MNTPKFSENVRYHIEPAKRWIFFAKNVKNDGAYSFRLNAEPLIGVIYRYLYFISYDA